MTLTLFSGRANRSLAEATAKQLGRGLGRATVDSFPDGELNVQIEESVRDHDVYLIQPTSPPAERHLLELLLLTDACRRAGARRLTAVIPYFGYARQDRRATGREPVAARVVTDLLHAARLDRVVAVDLHSTALEGFFTLPLEHLSALPRLVDAVRPRLGANAVVVAPDLGASKLAEHCAQMLELPMALVHKVRSGAEEVRVRRITGEVRKRAPCIVDDMISTGSTLEAAASALLEAGCLPEITVMASHGLFVGSAIEKLTRLPLRALVVTDSVAAPDRPSFDLEIVSLSSLLAEAIDRLHRGRSMGELLRHG